MASSSTPSAWSDEEDRLLVELKESGHSAWGDIAATLGRSVDACRGRWKRKLKDRKEEQPVAEADQRTILEAWKSQGDKPGWQEIVAHMAQGAELQDRLRPNITAIRRAVTSQRDILVVSMSDFHLGSPATDYAAFLDTTKLLLSDDRFYILVVGPDLETAFTWFHSAEAVLNQVAPPWMQLEAYRLWLNGMLSRTLAVAGDNHTDRRLERYLGDIGLIWREDVPYFRTYGLLSLEVGTGDGEPVTYKIALKHQYKGHSIYHSLQPVLRVFRDIDPSADVYITAHTHRPAHLSGVFYPEMRPDRPVQHFIVNGTFKTGCDIYAQDRFGGRGVLGLPTLRLSPHRFRILYYDSPQDALESMS